MWCGVVWCGDVIFVVVWCVVCGGVVVWWCAFLHTAPGNG